MSDSNYCFLTYKLISQEAGQVIWYSHLFKNFPHFVVIHTVKGFGIVNKAKQMFFWNSLAFSVIQRLLAIWSLVPLSFQDVGGIGWGDHFLPYKFIKRSFECISYIHLFGLANWISLCFKLSSLVSKPAFMLFSALNGSYVLISIIPIPRIQL